MIIEVDKNKWYQEKEKEFIVTSSHTIDNPYTMVIHLKHTSIT